MWNAILLVFLLVIKCRLTRFHAGPCGPAWNLFTLLLVSLVAGARGKSNFRHFLLTPQKSNKMLQNNRRYIFQLLILFLVPGLVMAVAYGLISLELYRGIQFEVRQRQSSQERKNSFSGSKYEDGDGCYLQKSRRRKRLEMHQLSSNYSVKVDRVRSSSSTANLMAKKRVIRMLIVIVILFFLCWTPVFSVNTWRAFNTESASVHLSGAPISFIHLLSYTSACVNPIIYCFMNKRFRLGFLATFTCCYRQSAPTLGRGAGTVEEESRTTRASISRYTYSNVSLSAAASAPT